METVEVHQKLKIELPYDLGISLWSIYLKETKTLTWKPNVHCSNICSVARLCLTLCNPMDCSMPGSSVLHYLPKFAQIHVHWTGDAIYLILCGPFLLLPSIFSSIRVFSNQSALLSRWPKDWSFSFPISPFNEYSGLTSFRIDWFDLLAAQRTLNAIVTSRHHYSKESTLFSFFYNPSLTSRDDY